MLNKGEKFFLGTEAFFYVTLYHPMEVGYWAQQCKAGTLNKGEKSPLWYRGLLDAVELTGGLG